MVVVVAVDVSRDGPTDYLLVGSDSGWGLPSLTSIGPVSVSVNVGRCGCR